MFHAHTLISCLKFSTPCKQPNNRFLLVLVLKAVVDVKIITFYTQHLNTIRFNCCLCFPFFSILFIFIVLLLQVPLVWNVPVHESQLSSASDLENLSAKPSATAKQREMLSVQRVQGDPDPHNGTHSQETSCRT